MKKEEKDDEMGQYDYCPICGVDWTKIKKHKCELMTIIDNQKPRFYSMDLNNYTSDFLRDIIKWQDMKIRVLQGESPGRFDLGLKDNDGVINSIKPQKKR